MTANPDPVPLKVAVNTHTIKDGTTNKRILKATIVGPVVKDNLTTGQTKELPPDDLMANLMADGRVITPPFDKLTLGMLPEHSTELGQVVDAMMQNIDGFGYRLECLIKMDNPDLPPGLKDEVMAERAELVNFFNYCCPEYSFTELRKRTRKDIETTGEGYWEVVRVPGTGEVVQFNHVPSHQINLGPQEQNFTKYSYPVQMVQANGSVELRTISAFKRFRRFVQSRSTTFGRLGSGSGGLAVRWFKEFGDPRVMNNITGEFVSKQEDIDKLPEEQRASEMIHWKLYSSRTPYGLPRYVGNLITIFGDRAADEVNYVTLKNNNIPSMVVMVSGGQLTDASINRMAEFVETQVQGSDNYSRFLILECEGQYEGGDGGGMKLDLKPLTDQQLRDQMFQNYGKNNKDKIRECFRLPPIFVGRADDYTRATAEASRRLADEQVFRPERDEFDVAMNQRFLPLKGARYHVFKSNGPNVTDDADLIAILDSAERCGAMTPRIARMILADILGKDESLLPAMDPSIKLDVPFSLQVAEAVKNQAEPMHQLAVKNNAALKMMLDVRDTIDAEMTKRRRSRREEAAR